MEQIDRIKELINIDRNIINEGILTRIFGGMFKGVVASTAETLLRKVIDDVLISGGKKVTIGAIRNNANYKKALVTLVDDATKKLHPDMTFKQLTVADKNAAQKIVDDVSDAMRTQLDEYVKDSKAVIIDDLSTSAVKANDITNDIKAGGKSTTKDLSLATKEVNQDAKLASKIESAERSVAGLQKETVGSIEAMLKRDAKLLEETTGKNAADKLKKGTTTVKTSKGIFTVTKEQLARFKKVKKYIVGRGIRAFLIKAGVPIVAAFVLWQMFGPDEAVLLVDENGNDIADDSSVLGPEWAQCMLDIVKTKQGVLTKSSNGESTVFVVNTGNPEFDQKGGLQFYSNGRVFTRDMSKNGNWTCKAGKASLQEIYSNLLKEQSTEIDINTLSNISSETVNDLDGWVGVNNLQRVYNNLISLNGKTYKGKSAIDSLKYFYKKDEGDDLYNDVSSVGTKHLSAIAVQLQSDILDILKGTEQTAQQTPTDGTTPPVTPTGSIFDKVDIKWSDGSSSGSNKQRKSIYQDKFDFPFPKGTRNLAIKEVQICLGLPAIYQTGNFGPITENKLKEKGYDVTNGLTKDLYDKIKAACGRSSNQIAPVPGSEFMDTNIPPSNIPDANRDVNKAAELPIA